MGEVAEFRIRSVVDTPTPARRGKARDKGDAFGLRLFARFGVLRRHCEFAQVRKKVAFGRDLRGGLSGHLVTFFC